MSFCMRSMESFIILELKWINDLKIFLFQILRLGKNSILNGSLEASAEKHRW